MTCEMLVGLKVINDAEAKKRHFEASVSETTILASYER